MNVIYSLSRKAVQLNISSKSMKERSFNLTTLQVIGEPKKDTGSQKYYKCNNNVMHKSPTKRRTLATNILVTCVVYQHLRRTVHKWTHFSDKVVI